MKKKLFGLRLSRIYRLRSNLKRKFSPKLSQIQSAMNVFMFIATETISRIWNMHKQEKIRKRRRNTSK